MLTSRKTVLVIVAALGAIWLTSVSGTTGYAAGETVLTGRITAAAGQPMEGVIVSARRFGSTFTTSVYTDAAGEYYFPRMDEGKYNIWAQAVGYDAGIVEGVTLSPAVHRQNFALASLENFELQLRGDEWVASLPDATPHDRKMKEVFRLNCFGGCHSPSHALKDRYDEQGWKILIDKMSRIATPGTYTLDEDRNVAPLMHYYKDELAAYLARVRGPVPNRLALKPRPRPQGEETLAVFREYDSSPPGFGVPLYNDGSLWQLGPANKTDLKNMGPLRATVDLDGNPWFTGRGRGYWTIAKIDWKTGKITGYKVTNANGAVVDGGEMITDRQGVVWTQAAGKLVRIDRAGRMELMTVPEPEEIRRSQGATVPAASRGKERIWWEDGPRPAICSNGLCENPPTVFYMYEPSTGRWAVYENPPAPKDMKAFNDVYNVTSMGDADGNGWWAQFATDVMVKADGSAPGKVVTIKIPERKNSGWNLFTGDDRRIFEMMGGSEPHTRGVPYQHSMRMVGAGPGPTDSVWGVGWFSSDLIRVNIRTNKLTVYDAPAPDCGSYQTWTDPHGDVWTVCQSSAHIRRFSPKTEQWMIYDLPTLNIEAHAMGMAPGLVDGRVRMVVPSWTNSKTIMMDVRTPADIAALKAEVQRLR
ncbi:MAG: carboxypeptidase regulatory-like domain-containing protein [Vicinamibacterales bacterium]